jgi:long-chain acyl-CoA synthetase
MILVPDRFLDAVQRFGSRPALADGAVRMDYARLGERTRRLAVAWRALGLVPGDRVAVLSHNSFRYQEAYLAAPRAGLVLQPVNPRLAPPEIAFILNDGEAAALLVSPSCLPLYVACRKELRTVRHVAVLDDDAPEGLTAYEPWIAATGPLALEPHRWRPDDLFQLCYTGGTTGRPKGVMLSAANVTANVDHAIAMMGLAERSVWLHAAPMFHAADAWSCFAVSQHGAFHVFMESFDAERTLQLIQEFRVTATSIVPTMILRMLDLPGQERYDTSSLRCANYGASPMPVDRLAAAWKRFGPVLQQSYGQTESAPFLTRLPPADSAPERPGGPLRRPASCGRALPGVELRIGDAQDNTVPPGTVGQILARGDNVMLGYWRRPEETAAALRGGWLHTGDLAMMDEAGYVTIVDRAKDVVISGGENVYSSEVENALYRHPAVREAAVIGVPDPRWGEAVKAIVALRPGERATAAELIAHCRGLLGGYKCPKSVEFRESLPKSGAGKILKAELRAPYWEGQARKIN